MPRLPMASPCSRGYTRSQVLHSGDVLPSSSHDVVRQQPLAADAAGCDRVHNIVTACQHILAGLWSDLWLLQCTSDARAQAVSHEIPSIPTAALSTHCILRILWKPRQRVSPVACIIGTFERRTAHAIRALMRRADPADAAGRRAGARRHGAADAGGRRRAHHAGAHPAGRLGRRAGV